MAIVSLDKYPINPPKMVYASSDWFRYKLKIPPMTNPVISNVLLSKIIIL